MYQGLIDKYREYLPVAEGARITLYEGNTPLVQANRFASTLNIPAQVFFKLEGLNPTGSFKDRGMTYALSKAVEAGARAIMCASTGNTSASAAAYAARAGVRSIVLIPKGKIAYGKLSQALQYGAEVIQIDGNFDKALKLVRELCSVYPVTLVNSVNPDRLKGQMTGAFEVCDQLGQAPDYHFLPVGNAGNISAYWMGYAVYHKQKKITKRPHMMGFQASGAAPLVLGHSVRSPKTIATAIRIGQPASADLAIKARDESRGMIASVTDREILNAYDMIARLEGIFCEPASAAGIAGIIRLAAKGLFKKNQIVVCTLTGNGLKDPDVAVSRAQKPVTCKPDVKSLVRELGL